MELKSMNEELKNCPFCGGEASLSEGQMGSARAIAYFVECIECAATSDMLFSTVEAIEKWNSRI